MSADNDNKKAGEVEALIKEVLDAHKALPITAIAIACIHQGGVMSSTSAISLRELRPAIIGALEVCKQRILIKEIQDIAISEAMTAFAMQESEDATKQ